MISPAAPRHFAGLHGPLEGPEVRQEPEGVARTYSLAEMLQDPDEPVQTAKEAALAFLMDESFGDPPARMCDQKMLAEMSNASPSPVKIYAENTLQGVHSDVHNRIDELEAAIVDNLEPVHLPVVHTFTESLYCRRIFMPAGTVLTSKEHLTEHQYAILAGVALVTIPGQKPMRLSAPHGGVTRPGTRRALLIEEDCTWATYHPLSPAEERLRASGASESQLLACIEERIIGKREREDGRNIHREYKERLAAKGLPGPNDGARALEESV